MSAAGRGFLARIGRLGFRRQRLAVGVEELDLGGAVELSDRLALRLLGDIARGLVLDLLEGREGLGSHAFDLDDVPTELRLHRIGNLAFLQLEGGFGEFRHHAVLGEPAEIAAFAARILGEFGCDLGEVLAAFDARERRLRLVLGRQQDMAGMDLLLRRLRLGGLVIGLPLRLIGRRSLGDRAEQLLHRQLVAVIGHLARELRAVRELVGLGLLGRELEVDEIVEHVLLPRRAFEFLRQAGADVGHRVGDVALGDRRAVDLGQHLRIGQGCAAEAESCAEPERERKGGRARARENRTCHGGSFGASGKPFASDFAPAEAAIEGFGRQCEGKEMSTVLKNARPAVSL